MKRYCLPAICVCFVLCWTGCSLPFDLKSRSAERYVLLEVPGKKPASVRQRNERLLVAETESSSWINSRRLLFSDDPKRRSSYQFSTWVEPPPSRFSALLLYRIDRAGLFRSVTGQSSATVGDLLLRTELEEFYHDTAREPGTARVLVRAELVDLKKSVVISRKTFREAVKSKSFDAEGAVEGLTRAVNRICDGIVLWLDSAAP